MKAAQKAIHESFGSFGAPDSYESSDDEKDAPEYDYTDLDEGDEDYDSEENDDESDYSDEEYIDKYQMSASKPHKNEKVAKHIAKLQVAEATDDSSSDSSDPPSLSEIILSFDADGNFLAEKKSLLYQFLSSEDQAQVESLIQANPSETSYILTQLAMHILQTKLHVYKGEWEMVAKKAKKQTKSKANQNSEYDRAIKKMVLQWPVQFQ